MTFRDTNAWMTGQGNLSLGNSGFDDGAGDPAYPYAKGDCFIDIPLTCLYVTGGASTITRPAAGQFLLTLTGAATAYIVGIPFPLIQRKFTNIRGGGQNPKGFRLTDLVIAYTVGTAALTFGPTVAFFTEVETNGAARAATAAALGAVTYENPVGTPVGAPPAAVAANPVVFRAVPAAPVFVTGDNTHLVAELALTTGAAGNFGITSVKAHCSVALY